MTPDELVDDYERALIGAVLTDPAWIPPLRPEEFWQARHRALWEAIQAVAAAGHRPEAPMVQGWLKQHDKLDGVGGIAHLAQMLEAGALAMDVDGYATKIREAATSRELRRFGKELQLRAGTTPEEAEAVLAALPRSMRVARFDGQEVWRGIQADWLGPSLRFGLPAVDNVIGGAREGDLIVVGARTSHGKTAFCVSATLEFLAQQAAVAFYTLETSTAGIYRRLIAAKGRVSLKVLRSGAVSPSEYAMADEVAAWLAARPLTVWDVRSLGGKSDRRVCEALAVESAQVIVIDHVQEVITDDRESRAYALGQLFARLKELAVRDRKIVLVAAQCSRQAEQRQRPLPTLGDLKESGGIEERADVVLLLHYWVRGGEKDRSPEDLEVLVSKNRDGGTGRASVRFIARCGVVTTFDAPASGSGEIGKGPAHV